MSPALAMILGGIGGAIIANLIVQPIFYWLMRRNAR